jgi:hypothetical protein
MAGTTIEPKGRIPLPKGSLRNLFFPPRKREYEYFKGARDHPFTRGAEIVKAAWAADAALLCYARYGTRRMADQEFQENLARGGLTLRRKIGENPANWNAPGTQAFFATGDGFAFLAFRGTEVDDPRDKLADLDFLLVHERDYRSSPPTSFWHLPALGDLLSMPCLVHRGFQGALDRVWDQVLVELTRYRRENPEGEICLTGHSLGGALALLTYSRLSDPNVAAYTFGCPRVGDVAFRDRVMTSRGKGHFRCVNGNDLVAHVPLESALYVHAPERCYRFDDAGHLDGENEGALAADLKVMGHAIHGLAADLGGNLRNLDKLPAPPGAVDHSPARYCIRLWNCVG